MQNRDVVVVGGGIAGLACAALLARGGRSVTLLERSTALGGLARSRSREGFMFNRGAHALYQGGPAQAVLASLGVELRGRAPSLRGIAYFKGRRHRLPASPWAVLTTGLLSWRGRAAVARLFGRIATLQGDARSASAWVDEVTDDASARAFLAAMLRLSTYCGDLESIRSDVAVAALRQGSVHGVRYLDGGWQQLVDALVEVCERAGVELHTGTPVEHADAHGVGLRDGSQLGANDVVLAVPPAVASRWVDVPTLSTSRVACLDVALSTRPSGPRLAFDLDDPMYLAVHSDTAAFGPGALVHTIHYGAPDDARDRLEALLDRTLPRWRDALVHTQFFPDITVTRGVVGPRTPERPAVRSGGMWRVGDAVGRHGFLADAAFGSAQEVARAMLDAATHRAA